jgi:hypothetical protein
MQFIKLQIDTYFSTQITLHTMCVWWNCAARSLYHFCCGKALSITCCGWTTRIEWHLDFCYVLLFKIGFMNVRLTRSFHLRFTLHHVVTLHICTFPVRAVFRYSNVSTGNAQASIDMSLANTRSNAGVHKSVTPGRHCEWISTFNHYRLLYVPPV